MRPRTLPLADTEPVLPDGRHTAILFQHYCGATTGFSAQISILSPEGKISEGGNAFRADDNYGAARVGAGVSSDMPRSRPLFMQDEEVSGVRIAYQAINGSTKEAAIE